MTNESYYLKENRKSFQEVWYLKLNEPAQNRALWLRFTLLLSKNGYKKISEVWGIFFQKKENGEILKTALKQTFPLACFKGENNKIQIQESFLTDHHTQGMIEAKGQHLKWNLEIKSLNGECFDLVPKTLSKTGVIKNKALTVHENLSFSGTCLVNGESYSWEQSPGMQAHLAGSKNGHSWVWSHCNYFLDEKGQPAQVVFEGLSARAKLLCGVPSPKLSTFYFNYQDKAYHLNSLWSAIRSRSQSELSEWNFEAESPPFTFKGQIKAELKSFAGITYEDTDGSLLYCSNSKLSEMTLVVYKNGKPEARFYAPQTAAFEFVSRKKNPYVPLLL